MPDTPNRLPRTLGPQPSWYSAVEGPEMQASNESTVTPRTATTRRQYPAPEAWTEWSSERRDHLEIRDPRRSRPRTISDNDAGSTLSKLPELPTPQREGLKLIDRSRGYEYTLTTHIVPAAWPRSTPEIGCPAGCSPDGSRDRGAFRRVRKEMLDVEKRYLRGELPERRDEREYWFCVNRYVRNRLEESERKGRKRLTLYLAHAVGFGKECWEPTLSHLLSNLGEGDPIIDEIWSWDAVNHGDSALLNKENLGSLYDWSDNARDIINFLLNYLPDSVESHPTLPTHLQRVPANVSETRAKYGFSHRTLVGIGHSFGGSSTALAVINKPILFSSLILVDPGILPPPPSGKFESWAEAFEVYPAIEGFMDGALTRRSAWKSKAHALETLKKIPWFAAWHPLALEIYVDCQIFEDKKGGEAKLKMARVWEAATYTDLRTMFEVWDRMGGLDQRVRLHFIQPEFSVSPKMTDSRRHMVWLRPKNSSNVMLPGHGHLLCQEAPETLGRELSWLFGSEYGYLKSKL